MAIENRRVTVTTTATALDDRSIAGEVQLRNLDAAATLYVGAADLTADDTDATGGFPVYPGEVQTFTTKAGETLYGRAAAATTVRVAVLYSEN